MTPAADILLRLGGGTFVAYVCAFFLSAFTRPAPRRPPPEPRRYHAYRVGLDSGTLRRLPDRLVHPNPEGNRG